MKKTIHLSILFLLFTQLLPSNEITLNQFFELVKNNNPNYHKISLQKKIANASQNMHLGDKNWKLENQASYYNKEVTGQYPTDPESLDGFQNRFSMQKNIWETGGTFNASFTSNQTNTKYLDSANLFGLSNSEFSINTLAFSYTQPLLKNLFGKQDKLPYELKRFATSIESINELEAKETLLLQYGEEFLNCALLSQKVAIMNKRLTFSISQRKQVKKKLEQNIVEKVDLLRAKSIEKFIEQQKAIIEADFKSSKIKISYLANSPQILDHHIVYNFNSERKLPETNHIIASLLKKSRHIQILNKVSSQLNHHLLGLKNSGKPDLSLRLDASFEDGDRSYSKASSFDKTNYTASLLLNYPIGNRRNKEERNKLRWQLKETNFEIQNKKLNLESKTRSLLSKLNYYKKIINIDKDRIAISIEKTKEEEKFYNTGRSQLSILIQSQDEVQEAKFSLLNNAANYHLLLLKLDALRDQLILNKNIHPLENK